MPKNLEVMLWGLSFKGSLLGDTNHSRNWPTLDILHCMEAMLETDANRAARSCPSMKQLRAQKAAIVALAREHGARRIRVFGSVARNEQTSRSDIDFLVEFPRGYDMLGQRVALTLKLADLLGCRLDLVPEHELNADLRQRVLQEAVEW